MPGVLGMEIRLGKKVEHGVKEAKNVVSGCNGARTLPPQRWGTDRF